MAALSARHHRGAHAPAHAEVAHDQLDQALVQRLGQQAHHLHIKINSFQCLIYHYCYLV